MEKGGSEWQEGKDSGVGLKREGGITEGGKEETERRKLKRDIGLRR